MSMLIASFPDTAEIGKKVAEALKADYSEIDVSRFPDSEFNINLRKNPKDKTVVIVSSLGHGANEEIVETVLAGGIAKDYNAKEIVLVATYFPYLRQDKRFEVYGSLSSKHILRIFDSFDKIIVVDPHLHRVKKMPDFYYKAESISAKMLIADYIKKRFKDNFDIIGPDSESEQWSKTIADALGKKVVILDKTRFSGTKIKQKDFKDSLRDNVIIIDDIISTGRTIAGALSLAKKHGAKNLYCIGIHGLLVDGADKLITKNAELITTNTVPNEYSKIDVSPIIIEKLRKLK